MESIYNYRLKTKSADVTEKGRVTILANGLEIRDHQGDISARGSFKKTLNDFKNGRNSIYHYLNHDSNHSIGLILDGYESDTHLVLESQLNLRKQLGLEAYEDYRLAAEYGRNVEHSVGVIPVKRAPKNKARVLEWVLKEVSTLTKPGANPSTGFIDLKSLDADTTPALAVAYIRSVLQARYGDDKLKHYEKQLDILEKAMKNNEIRLVQCPKCGLAFDYNSVQEKSLLDDIMEVRKAAIDRNITAKGDDAMRSDLLAALQITKEDDTLSYVHCPHCHTRITKAEQMEIRTKAEDEEENIEKAAENTDSAEETDKAEATPAEVEKARETEEKPQENEEQNNAGNTEPENDGEPQNDEPSDDTRTDEGEPEKEDEERKEEPQESTLTWKSLKEALETK